MTDDANDLRMEEMRPEDQRARLDQLFQMTQRGPFSGFRPEEVLSETDGLPLVAGGVTEDQLLPLMIQGFILGGIHNDRFVHQPPDITEVISDIDNKLPGWSFTDNTAAGATATWTEESNDSGYLAFAHADDTHTDGDEVYIEQYVFVPGGNITILAPSMFCEDQSSGIWKPFMGVQWVNPDGTLQGSETRTEYTGVAAASGGAIHRTWMMSRTRTYAFLRIRMGFTAHSTGSGAGTTMGKMYWAWVEPPESYDVTLRWGRGIIGTDWAPAASTTYNIPLADIAQTFGSAKWVAPTPGIILAISAMHDDATGVTAGKIEFKPAVNNVAVTDPIAEFNATNAVYALDQRDLEGVTAFDFARGDQIDIEAVTDGSYVGPSTNWSGTLHCRMVFDNAEDATGGGIGPAGG